MNKTRRRCGVGIVVLASLIASALWWSSQEPVTAQAAYASGSSAQGASPAASRVNVVSPSAALAAEGSSRLQAPVVHEFKGELIASVKMDRERVCAGEPVEVSVELLPTARDARVAINATSGATVVLNPRQVGQYPVIVFAHGWDGELDSRTEHLEVEDCAPTSRLGVSVHPAPGEDEVFDFEVDQVEGLGDLSKVRWDFGDGQPVQETSELSVQHSYWDRPQQGPQASYVVKVEVVDRAGLKASAKLHVSMVNDAWVVARGGVFELPMRRVGLPWRAADQRARVEVELRPFNPEAKVRLKDAQVSAYACEGDGELLTQRLSAAQLLNVREVAGDRATRATLMMPAALSQGRCRWAVELYGEQGKGQQVTARVGFDLGPIGAEQQLVGDRARAKASFEAMIKQAGARKGK